MAIGVMPPIDPTATIATAVTNLFLIMTAPSLCGIPARPIRTEKQFRL
jgi:hypothetical protein